MPPIMRSIFIDIRQITECIRTLPSSVVKTRTAAVVADYYD